MVLSSIQDLACFIRFKGDKRAQVQVFVNDVHQPRVSWFDEHFSNSIRFVLPNKLVVLDVNGVGPITPDLDRIDIVGYTASVYLRA
jgi:hypothetical protein